MKEQELTFKELVAREIKDKGKFDNRCYGTFVMAKHPGDDPNTDKAVDEVLKVLDNYSAYECFVVAIVIIEGILITIDDDRITFGLMSSLRYFCQMTFDNHLGERYDKVRTEVMDESLNNPPSEEDIEELFKERGLNN